MRDLTGGIVALLLLLAPRAAAQSCFDDPESCWEPDDARQTHEDEQADPLVESANERLHSFCKGAV